MGDAAGGKKTRQPLNDSLRAGRHDNLRRRRAVAGRCDISAKPRDRRGSATGSTPAGRRSGSGVGDRIDAGGEIDPRPRRVGKGADIAELISPPCWNRRSNAACRTELSCTSTLPVICSPRRRSSSRPSSAIPMAVPRPRPSRHLDGRAAAPRWRSRLNRGGAAPRPAGALALVIVLAATRLPALSCRVGLGGSRLGFLAPGLAGGVACRRNAASTRMCRAVAEALDAEGIEGRAQPSRDRRARSGGARRSRRRAGGDREPGREFLRRRRRAAVLARARRPARRRRLQGGQHRRLHDRPSQRALRGFRLGGGAVRRSHQPAQPRGSPPCGSRSPRGSTATPARLGSPCAATPAVTARPTPAGRKRPWPAPWASSSPAPASTAA